MPPTPFPIKVTITVTGRPGIGKTTILRRIEAAINTLHLQATSTYIADHHQLVLHVATPRSPILCGVLPPKPTSDANETTNPSNS